MAESSPQRSSAGLSVLYLHGFASSPLSRKVILLREILEPSGIELLTPDLNVPSFARLSFQGMVEKAMAMAADRHIAAIAGSSLGSLVALSVSQAMPSIPLVLIAPALGVSSRWIDRIPDGMDPVPVFNHASGGEETIHRRFFEEMAGVRVDRHAPAAVVTVLMGRLDESVGFDAVSERWEDWSAQGLAEGSRFIEIVTGDHGLTDHAPAIAEEIARAARTAEPSF